MEDEGWEGGWRNRWMEIRRNEGMRERGEGGMTSWRDEVRSERKK